MKISNVKNGQLTMNKLAHCTLSIAHLWACAQCRMKNVKCRIKEETPLGVSKINMFYKLI